jgi:hypothetical protein
MVLFLENGLAIRLYLIQQYSISLGSNDKNLVNVRAMVSRLPFS